MVKVTAVQDNDGSWYVIPSLLTEQFNRLVDEPDKEDFNILFSEFACANGDLNSIQLYAKL